MEKSLRLPKLLSSGCVIQQGPASHIWGRGKPGSTVSVTLGRSALSTVVDSDGTWQVSLALDQPGGPYNLTVRSGDDTEEADETITRTCYVGEVVLCSGQSNMELDMAWVKERYSDEFEVPEDEYLRQYKIVEEHDFEAAPSDHASAQWESARPESLGGFSALGYFAGKKLRRELGVPVGIINASLGGSPIESWMSKELLQKYPRTLAQLQGYETNAEAEERAQKSLERRDAWYRSLENQEPGDTWKPLQVPFQDEFPGFNGRIDLTKTLWLHESESTDAFLHLGTLVDADETFVNGVSVGSTDNQYPPRNYAIPVGVLHEGKNVITVHLIAEHGGARWTPGKEIYLQCGPRRYSLEGTWQYRTSAAAMEPCPSEDFIRWKPTVLYNAMLTPCFPMTVSSVLWYQGESNAGDPEHYEALLSDMIALWREKWGIGDLPFFIAQLPGFAIDGVEDGGWAGIRAAQSAVADSGENVTTVTSLDCGEWNDLHPMDKKTIADRIATAVLAQVYHSGEWTPPTFSVGEVLGNRVVLHFAAGSDPVTLTTLDGNNPGEFCFVWDDGSRVAASACMTGSDVVLSLPAGRRPQSVVYAWSNAPSSGLICDEAGVPVSPFVWHLPKEEGLS